VVCKEQRESEEKRKRGKKRKEKGKNKGGRRIEKVRRKHLE
jgi:hypothetical protein